VRPVDLSARVLTALTERAGIDRGLVEDVMARAVGRGRRDEWWPESRVQFGNEYAGNRRCRALEAEVSARLGGFRA
jgi:hypothetical protein